MRNVLVSAIVLLNAASDKNTTFWCEFCILAVFTFAKPKYIPECQIELHCAFIAVRILKKYCSKQFFL